ncbi:hypothetical protein Mag101_08425 [Microbulbifer agarilyticus]|uniref:SnoaL-like domain-containing protein n=1 Tax=Microbulbifer agarilyticus TaxID=260552 RepID=A0A1Q2M4S9_9GAMM|nr:hypothetical protein [Microbulbifer agarilyticus]AQQ67659.1 hypothetical protein Mag101_08425 [Microbulbifer agarilyticus]
MSDPIVNFFDAWKIEDPTARFEKVASAVTKSVDYDDPRTPETINGINALSDYVGMFSANAPGWSAKVINTDTTAGVTRATVAFSGLGPDGSEKVQIGQYFVEQEGELITRMVGFVGTGE